MVPGKSQPQARRLAARLAQSGQPLYLVSPDGEIEFANQPLADWLGVSIADLLRRKCRYHSDPTGNPLDDLAALLAPPPEAFAGQAIEAPLHLATVDGGAKSAWARFVPIALPDEEHALILVVLDTDSDRSASAATSSEATQLHAQLQALRIWQWGASAAHAGPASPAQFNSGKVWQLLGNHPRIRRARSQCELAMQSASNVLVVAAAGAQAQLVARAIHAARAKNTMLIPIDGARSDAETIADLLPGWNSSSLRSAAANGATILCLAVDQLSPEARLELEARLRQAPAAVRTVSTAQQPLETLVATGDFPLGLACRLSTILIDLPRLSERPEDVPLMAQAIVEECNRAAKRQLGGFTTEALDRLAEHTWPGDLDELTSVVRQSWQLAIGPMIGVSDLPPRFLAVLNLPPAADRQLPNLDLEAFLSEVETELLRRALALVKGNKTRAAKLLGMTRPRLYRRLVQRGLELPNPALSDNEIDWLDSPEDDATAEDRP